jgi:hypothetical protein
MGATRKPHNKRECVQEKKIHMQQKRDARQALLTRAGQDQHYSDTQPTMFQIMQWDS